MHGRFEQARFALAGFLMLLVAAAQGAASGEAEFLTESRQLLFEGKRSGEGYFSPDGQQLIFQSEREPDNPFYQIYILDLASGDTHRVSPGSGKTTCAFFRPGADEVLFASTHHDPEARAKMKAHPHAESVTVTYDASAAPKFKDQIAESASIWNRVGRFRRDRSRGWARARTSRRSSTLTRV